MQNKYKLKPYTLVIRTTERCNVGCYHCSISATPKGNDIPLSLAQNAIKDAKRLGLSRVHLTGGEPLLYNNLPDLVQQAKEENIIVDMTSSTFTQTAEDTTQMLKKMHKDGLCCVMLSYDTPHAKRVSLEHFCYFAKTAQNLGMEVCVFVTEGVGTDVTIENVKQAFVERKIDICTIEWTKADYQFEGRGEKQLPKEINEKQNYPRCPYVMAVPTLNPDGKVYLCHCARFSTPNFTVGKYPEQTMDEILKIMENKPIYRYLAKYGPQQALSNLGISQGEIPFDMCRSCNKYLSLLENQGMQEQLNSLVEKDELSNIPIDFEAVLSTYKRHLQLYGEKLN